MTNRELLQAPRDLLKPVERQKQHVLQSAAKAMACPACGQGINIYEAAGIDVNQYDFGRTKLDYRCPCGAELQLVELPGSSWHWVLEPAWLHEQLSKATAYDHIHKAQEGR